MGKIPMQISSLLILCAAATLCAQSGLQQGTATPPKTDVSVPRFEVVSVRQYKGEEPWPQRIVDSPDGFFSEGVPLKMMIGIAYGFRWDSVLNGPSWIDSVAFNIQAKVADAEIETLKKLTPMQRNSMLKPLLAERFHLQVHTGTRMVPVYELVVTKGGSKLKSSNPAPNANASSSTARKMLYIPGQIRAQSTPARSLASALTSALGRKVVDKTGLTGVYDFTLKWTPIDMAAAASNTNQEAEPEIFTALKEQLGLEVKSAKGPIDVLIVDRLDMPDAN
jgi:uncharacterized protein (TIGR03435 family)